MRPTTLSYADAVVCLMEASKWTRADIEAKPHDAAWRAMERVYEWVHVIDSEANKRRDGLR